MPSDEDYYRNRIERAVTDAIEAGKVIRDAARTIMDSEPDADGIHHVIDFMYRGSEAIDRLKMSVIIQLVAELSDIRRSMAEHAARAKAAPPGDDSPEPARQPPGV